METFTTLITGASSGIGLHLAHAFAADRHRLILVAADDYELQQVARRLRTRWACDVDTIAVDLEQRHAADVISGALGSRVVDVLVNNAGQGQLGAFWEVPVERHLAILRLNIEAVVRLSARLLPGMIARGRGGLLNIASVAGFEPGPMLAVYHASKAFLLSWSESLATELEGTGVHATAVCPGPTDTGFFEKAQMLDTRVFREADLMEPKEVAKIAYRAFLDRERVVVTGALNKARVATGRLLPERVQAAKNEALYAEVELPAADSPLPRRRRQPLPAPGGLPPG